MVRILERRRQRAGNGGDGETVRYDESLSTFTPSMGKRLPPSGVFAAAPIVQGAFDGTGTPDVLSFSRGSRVSGNWYDNFDPYQGSISFWITPEWNGNDGVTHTLLGVDTPGEIGLLKGSNGWLSFTIHSVGTTSAVNVAGWTAGTRYHVVLSWGSINTLDGTNYVRVSVNDSHVFLKTAGWTSAVASTKQIGANSSIESANAIIEGLTIYRRPLWDGTYGVDVGNGDEVAAIYAAGAGKDPCEVTGSWDVVFALPTNASVGALTTGTGNAWSHPHSTNLLQAPWLSQGYYGGAANAVRYNATTTSVNAGSNATIDDIPAGDFTFDGWVRLNSSGGGTAGRIFIKGNFQLVNYASTLYLIHYHATTNAAVTMPFTYDGKWHHICGVYDVGTLTYEHFFLDGVDVKASFAVGVGALTTDAASSLYFGNMAGGTRCIDGDLGWLRFSDNKRWTANFTPPRALPAADGNTIEQWAFNEGTGTTIAATVTSPACDGTLSNGTWVRPWYDEGTPSLVADQAAATKIFPWGIAVTSDAANEGIYQDVTVTAGDNWVIRVIAHSDGTSVPKAVLYDQTNAAEIGSLTGSTASTRTAPDVLLFTGQAPAGCTTLRVKLVNTAASNIVYWHQVAVMTDLWDDPSMEAGTAPTDVGTPTTSEQSAVQAHSDTNSWLVVADAADEGIKRAITTTAGVFYHASAWVYADTAGTVDMEGPTAQKGGAAKATTSVNDAWQLLQFVFRATAASTDLQFTSNAAQTFYVDDVCVVPDTAVSLTATPASAANSVESGGIRVDGYDSCVQTTTNKLRATRGEIRWKARMRHSPANIVKFAQAAGNAYILRTYGGATYISVYGTAANTVTLSFNDGDGAHSTTWDCTAAWTADEELTFRVEYTAAYMKLWLANAVVATITTAINFATVPTTLYFGSASGSNYQADMVIKEI